MATYYTSVPAGYYDYSTSTSTSPSPDEYGRYAPPPLRTSKRHHVRTASFTPPRVSVWQSTPPYGASPTYYNAAPRYSSPPVAAANYDYVSSPEPSAALRSKTRRRSASGPAFEVHSVDINGRTSRRTSVRLPTQRIYVDASDDALDSDHLEPLYLNVEPRTTTPPSKSQRGTPKKKSSANSSSPYMQSSSHDVDTPVRSRARRSSTSTRPRTATPNSKSSSRESVATAKDAAEHDIPAGYVLKNWDPAERPVTLLGSVFDANSLGKWIFDWTVFHHDAGSPLAENAGELWLLLIQFSTKMKRAEEGIARVRGRENREMISDFEESGNRLWRRLTTLLKVCEEFMWEAARKECGKGRKPQMGEKSGVEFVKTIFGRDRQLQETEKLMSSVRLWNMRFDSNCDDLLRNRKR